MSNLENLKKEMNKIMEDNKPNAVYNSPADKRIREVELELTSAEIKVPFKISIDQLDPEKANESFGGSGFKRTEYALSWQQDPSGAFRLVLTNIPHKNAKVLIKTPEQFKEDAITLLDAFLEKFSLSIKNSN